MYFRKNLDETAREAADTAAAYREAAGLIPEVIRVIRQFDGKVYNCRFNKAVEEALKPHHIWCDGRYNSITINFRHDSLYDYRILALLEKKDLVDGKRIPADKWIEDARERQADYLKRAYELETSISQIGQIRGYVSDTVSRLNDYLDKLPFEVRQIMELPWKVSLS